MITSPGRRLMLTACLAIVAQFMCTNFAAADELDDITKAGVIKVGIFEDFPPFSSAGPDLKPQGYDIDVINALAALEPVLAAIGQPVDFGSSIGAAQKIFAERS